ncbi:hypothetical protein Tco_1262482 [Tanacetum coccineum]
MKGGPPGTKKKESKLEKAYILKKMIKLVTKNSLIKKSLTIKAPITLVTKVPDIEGLTLAFDQKKLRVLETETIPTTVESTIYFSDLTEEQLQMRHQCQGCSGTTAAPSTLNYSTNVATSKARCKVSKAFVYLYWEGEQGKPLPVENGPKRLKGSFIGFLVENVHVVIMDGASRAVDSSELAMSYNIRED